LLKSLVTIALPLERTFRQSVRKVWLG